MARALRSLRPAWGHRAGLLVLPEPGRHQADLAYETLRIRPYIPAVAVDSRVPKDAQDTDLAPRDARPRRCLDRHRAGQSAQMNALRKGLVDAGLEPSMDPFREFFIGRNPA
jgi:hypothetical protein